MTAILFILFCTLSGAIGYSLAYFKAEKKLKESRKKSNYTGYNGWNYYL